MKYLAAILIVIVSLLLCVISDVLVSEPAPPGWYWTIGSLGGIFAMAVSLRK